MRDLILQFIYLLPAYTGLTFGMLNALMRQKKYSQYLLIAICMTMSLHYYLDVSLMTATKAQQGYWIPLNTLTWLSMPILCGELFFNRVYPHRKGHILFFLALPIVLATVQTLCVWLGTPAQRLMDLTTQTIVPQVAAICLLIVILFRVFYQLNHPTRQRIGDFLLRKGNLSPYDLLGWVVCILMAMDIAQHMADYQAFRTHPGWTIAFCLVVMVMLFLFGYISQFVHLDQVSLEELQHPQLVVAMLPTELQQQEIDRKVAEESQLCDRIRQVVEGKKRYTNPDYTIAMLAEEVGVNRVYVSQAINHNLHNSFREYMNMLRIRRCKQMLREFPGMKQEELARECGFIDAPALNRKFKEIEGVTPAQWGKVNRVR